MADAGFYRGTSSEQDSRFTDKERKLLKQMRFEEALDEKICMDRVNLDVLKPWITAKLNEILGIEDDVVIEYVFTQLEEKSLNPKVMQINLTGFLNARRAREFMGELWGLLIEAQSSEDGIPASLVEKKMKEIQEKVKSTNISSSNGAAAEVAGSDWKNRYNSLTGGRYGNREGKIAASDERSRNDDERHRSQRDTDRDRESDRGRDTDRGRDSGRIKEDERIERKRGEERQSRDERPKSHSRSPTRRHLHDERMERKKERSRSPNRSPPRRRFTERKEETRRRSRSNERRKRKRSTSADPADEKQRKKKKKHSKKHTSDSDSERTKKRKKHKKEKKRKKRHSSDSD